MSAPITVETAIVFRAAGRRWFTKAAACRAAAKAKIRSKCECEPPEAGYWHGKGAGYPGMVCEYHKDEQRYGKLVRRLARFYARTLNL
jgi:hypothetical protein